MLGNSLLLVSAPLGSGRVHPPAAETCVCFVDRLLYDFSIPLVPGYGRPVMADQSWQTSHGRLEERSLGMYNQGRNGANCTSSHILIYFLEERSLGMYNQGRNGANCTSSHILIYFLRCQMARVHQYCSYKPLTSGNGSADVHLPIDMATSPFLLLEYAFKAQTFGNSRASNHMRNPESMPQISA
jgi:hypothetical protein